MLCDMTATPVEAALHVFSHNSKNNIQKEISFSLSRFP